MGELRLRAGARDISINYLQGEILNFAGLKAPPISFNMTLRKKWPVIIERGCKKQTEHGSNSAILNFWRMKAYKYYALHYNLISDIKHRRNVFSV